MHRVIPKGMPITTQNSLSTHKHRRGFKAVAQLVEPRIPNPRDAGSNPARLVIFIVSIQTWQCSEVLPVLKVLFVSF